MSSDRIVIAPDTNQIESVVIGSIGATVVVHVTDEGGASVNDVGVALVANPSGYKTDEYGSLLHGNAYTQTKQSSSFGNARFNGVPPGEIRIHAWTRNREGRIEEYVNEGEVRRLTIMLRPR